jgi:hypothetical protein
MTERSTENAQYLAVRVPIEPDAHDRDNAMMVMIPVCTSCGCMVAHGMVDHYPDRCAGREVDELADAIQSASREEYLMSAAADDD